MIAMIEASGPIIVTAELVAADQRWAEALRRTHYPAGRNHVPAHITLFHHLPPSLGEELRTLLREVTARPRPVARIGGPRSLGGGVAIGLACDDLLSIREALAIRFARDLLPQDRATPRLHITIQNKVDPARAAATIALLAGSLEPRRTSIAALACWHYRGGPWALISRHAFRR